jgi:hypothetical protein
MDFSKVFDDGQQEGIRFDFFLIPSRRYVRDKALRVLLRPVEAIMDVGMYYCGCRFSEWLLLNIQM